MNFIRESLIEEIKTVPAHSSRILIVDDDEDILANFSDILNDLGFKTETACDGDTALRLMEQRMSTSPTLPTPSVASGDRFDLCLVDYLMPGMNGTELLTSLRRMDPGLPVIMITAHVGSGNFELPPETDQHQVLRKPVDVAQLVALIQRLIR